MALRVLVADDERFFREAIRDALVAAGIPCDVAASGQDALRQAADPEVAVAVLDLGLPGVSGLEVLRRMRAERPDLRIVILAAQAEQQEVLEALRLGASDYLAKPLHDEELELAVRRALEAYTLEAELAATRDRLRALESSMAQLALGDPQAPPVEHAERLAKLAVEAVADVLSASKTSLMRLDPEAGELHVVAARGWDQPLSELDVGLVGEGIAGRAVARGEAFAVADVASDPRFPGRSPRSRYATGSFAVAPVTGPDGPLGVLCAADRSDGSPFGEPDVALLRILGLQLGALLGAALPAPLPEAESVRQSETEPLFEDDAGDSDADLVREVCEAITAEVEPGRLFEAALRPIARALPAAPVSLYLIDNQAGDLALESQCEGGLPDRPVLPRAAGLTASVLQTGWLVATDKPDSDPRFDPAADTPQDGAIGPLLCVPIRLRGKVLGVLRAFPRNGASASARTGEVLGAALSAAVRTALLYRSLLESVEEVAEARRESRTRLRPPVPRAGPDVGPGDGT